MLETVTEREYNSYSCLKKLPQNFARYLNDKTKTTAHPLAEVSLRKGALSFFILLVITNAAAVPGIAAAWDVFILIIAFRTDIVLYTVYITGVHR